MRDFSRHRMDIDVVCGCGYRATLPYLDVAMHFQRMGWGSGLDAALRRFRCSKCGCRPVRLGPIGR